jgi:hypothetical protein
VMQQPSSVGMEAWRGPSPRDRDKRDICRPEHAVNPAVDVNPILTEIGVQDKLAKAVGHMQCGWGPCVAEESSPEGV